MQQTVGDLSRERAANALAEHRYQSHVNTREKIPMIKFAEHNDGAWEDADDTRRSGSRAAGDRKVSGVRRTHRIRSNRLAPSRTGNALAPASRRAPRHEQAGGEAGAEPEKADRAERSWPVVGIDHENDFAAHSWRERGIAAFGE